MTQHETPQKIILQTNETLNQVAIKKNFDNQFWFFTLEAKTCLLPTDNDNETNSVEGRKEKFITFFTMSLAGCFFSREKTFVINLTGGGKEVPLNRRWLSLISER